MSNIPENLKYTKDHEWIRHEADGTCLVGITDHAQDSLGDVTFVELPAIGESFEEGATFGGRRVRQGGFRPLFSHFREKSPR